jgi:hypothetical protein
MSKILSSAVLALFACMLLAFVAVSVQAATGARARQAAVKAPSISVSSTIQPAAPTSALQSVTHTENLNFVSAELIARERAAMGERIQVPMVRAVKQSVVRYRVALNRLGLKFINRLLGRAARPDRC